MAKIPGDEFEQICKAFRDAYDVAALTRMLRFRLNRELGDIVKEGSKQDAFFELLTIAEMEGWLNELVREGRADKPNSSALQCDAISKLIGKDLAESKQLRSSTPNNLPRLQSFFGRENELATIREALDPGGISLIRKSPR